MQITASPFAKWLTQGDFYQLTLAKDQLLFTSHYKQVLISFEKWNGRVTLQRGLLWGALCFYNHNNQVGWRVSGVDVDKCKRVIHHALDVYQLWRKSKVKILLQLQPEMQSLIESFVNQDRYLKQTETLLMVEKLCELFEKTGLSIPLAEQFQPEIMMPIHRWLLEPETQLSLVNEQWKERQKLKFQRFFSECEAHPLNESQQEAILLNEDHTLVLAGAGSGKTSVIIARTNYLIQSGQAEPEDILLLAFGRRAAEEMSERIIQKLGHDIGKRVKVMTFHQLGLDIIRHVEYKQPKLSCIVADEQARKEWLTDVLEIEWKNTTAMNRWKRHLKKWPIAYLTGDIDLLEESDNEKLQDWLYRQITQLNSLQLDKKSVIDRIETHSEAVRLKSELNLIWPIYKAYLSTLKEEQAIDYEQMISQSTHYVKNDKYPLPWSYLFVDEYQDISPQRLDLIEAICHRENRHQQRASLFAVGDDWQAIYRFSGADISLITEFEKRFESCKVTNLSTSYRFNSQVGLVANRFIQENPVQLRKTLNSLIKQKDNAIKIIEHQSIEKELLYLSKYIGDNEKVLMLGRNHHHKPDSFNEWTKFYPNLNLEYMTCHASKGCEADYVFIVEMTEGLFPVKERAESLDCALLAKQEVFPYAEERRLFYVALTRAKNKVWIAYHGKPSPFIQELVDNDYPITIEEFPG